MSAARHAAALVACLALCGAGGARAGDFTEPGHHPGVVERWPSESEVWSWTRGPMNIADPGAGDASFGLPAYAAGMLTSSESDVFSLGDGGQITFRFDPGFGDRPGDDFAVFENGFFAPGGFFGELAFVEVSTDGTHFARFPATTQNPSPVSSQGVIDPTDYHNLAGKHVLGRGTGFDLAELASSPDVDIDDVHYVKLVDVIGNGSKLDQYGNAIYDPFPTPYASGGFDANAVGVPEPGVAVALAAGALCIGALSCLRRPCARPR